MKEEYPQDKEIQKEKGEKQGERQQVPKEA